MIPTDIHALLFAVLIVSQLNATWVNAYCHAANNKQVCLYVRVSFCPPQAHAQDFSATIMGKVALIRRKQDTPPDSYKMLRDPTI
jgi:hypothetical protein